MYNQIAGRQENLGVVSGCCFRSLEYMADLLDLEQQTRSSLGDNDSCVDRGRHWSLIGSNHFLPFKTIVRVVFFFDKPKVRHISASNVFLLNVSWIVRNGSVCNAKECLSESIVDFCVIGRNKKRLYVFLILIHSRRLEWSGFSVHLAHRHTHSVDLRNLRYAQNLIRR